MTTPSQRNTNNYSSRTVPRTFRITYTQSFLLKQSPSPTALIRVLLNLHFNKKLHAAGIDVDKLVELEMKTAQQAVVNGAVKGTLASAERK